MTNVDATPPSDRAPETDEPHETRRAEVEVGLERSVRHGRIMLVGAAVGALVAAIAALLLPVAPDANYELGQAVGLALVIGAAIGLALGALLALLLGLAVKRKQGAALAIQVDVQ